MRAPVHPYAEGGYVLRVVRIRGRRTGRLREVPLAVTLLEGTRWLCAPDRLSRDWVQNLAAAGECPHHRGHPRADISGLERHHRGRAGDRGLPGSPHPADRVVAFPAWIIDRPDPRALLDHRGVPPRASHPLRPSTGTSHASTAMATGLRSRPAPPAAITAIGSAPSARALTRISEQEGVPPGGLIDQRDRRQRELAGDLGCVVCHHRDPARAGAFGGLKARDRGGAPMRRRWDVSPCRHGRRARAGIGSGGSGSRTRPSRSPGWRASGRGRSGSW